MTRTKKNLADRCTRVSSALEVLATLVDASRLDEVSEPMAAAELVDLLHCLAAYAGDTEAA